MRIGVLSLQGDVSEHVDALERSGAEAVEARFPEDLDGLEGAVIPGGESTTISRLIFERGIDGALRGMLEEGRPVWGTCAGMVLLARSGGGAVENSGQELLGFLEALVIRNGFGGQRESFETDLGFDGFEEPFPGVFIRAPYYDDVGPEVEVLAEIEGRVVAARSGGVLATAFHPELVNDDRVHSYFLSMVEEGDG